MRLRANGQLYSTCNSNRDPFCISPVQFNIFTFFAVEYSQLTIKYISVAEILTFEVYCATIITVQYVFKYLGRDHSHNVIIIKYPNTIFNLT